MIYFIKAELTLDTRTNKVIIEVGKDKRIVLFPGKKVAEHWCDVMLNDRPQGPFSYAKDICKFLTQNLHGPRQQKKLIKEVSNA